MTFVIAINMYVLTNKVNHGNRKTKDINMLCTMGLENIRKTRIIVTKKTCAKTHPYHIWDISRTLLLITCEQAHLWVTCASDEEQSNPARKSLVSRSQLRRARLCFNSRLCSGSNFTITAEIHIHARSSVKFYCQYADGHMNLKFMPCVSEQERAIWQFVIIKNKLMSVFNASDLLLTVNFVITLSK